MRRFGRTAKPENPDIPLSSTGKTPVPLNSGSAPNHGPDPTKCRATGGISFVSGPGPRQSALPIPFPNRPFSLREYAGALLESEDVTQNAGSRPIHCPGQHVSTPWRFPGTRQAERSPGIATRNLAPSTFPRIWHQSGPRGPGFSQITIPVLQRCPRPMDNVSRMAVAPKDHGFLVLPVYAQCRSRNPGLFPGALVLANLNKLYSNSLGPSAGFMPWVPLLANRKHNEELLQNRVVHLLVCEIAGIQTSSRRHKGGPANLCVPSVEVGFRCPWS